MGHQKSSCPSRERAENLTRILFFGPLATAPGGCVSLGNTSYPLLGRQVASRESPLTSSKSVAVELRPSSTGRTAPQASVKHRPADSALSPRYRQRSTESRSVALKRSSRSTATAARTAASIVSATGMARKVPEIVCPPKPQGARNSSLPPAIVLRSIRSGRSSHHRSRRCRQRPASKRSPAQTSLGLQIRVWLGGSEDGFQQPVHRTGNRPSIHQLPGFASD